MDISHFELKGNKVEELSLLSKLAIVGEKDKESRFWEEKKGLGDENKGFWFNEFDERKAQFKAQIELKEIGSKHINLEISDIKLLLHLGFFMNLNNFVNFDDSLAGPEKRSYFI